MGHLAPGDSIGSYRIVGSVAGRLGVYRAVHASAPRRVIVKVAPSHDWRAVSVEMLRAASTLEPVCHPGIARVVDIGVLPDRRPWIASELVEGIALGDLIGRRRMAGIEVAALLRDAGEVLAHAHDYAVFHRHLTPSSIVLTTGARSFPLCIADWGDVRLSHDSEPTVFDAPERAISGPRDVYALGVIAFRAMTGAFPIGATYDVPDASGPLAELIVQMIAHDPAQRPSAAVVSARAEIIAGERVALAIGTPVQGMAAVRVTEMTAIAERAIAAAAELVAEAESERDGWIELDASDLIEVETRPSMPPPIPTAALLRRPRWTPPFAMSSELANAQQIVLAATKSRN